MIFVLAVFLSLVFIIELLIKQQFIISPSIVYCSVFLLSTVICCINYSNWLCDISVYTFGIIFFTVCLFVFSCNIGTICFKYCTKNKVNEISVKKHEYEISNFLFFVLLFFDIILLLFFYKTVVDIASKAGFSVNKKGFLLFYARQALTEGEESWGTFSNHSFLFSEAFCYISYYYYAYSKYYLEIKKRKYLIPLVVFFGFIILSTARTNIIYLFTYILVINGIFLKMKNKNAQKKMLYIIFFSFLVFLLIFFLTGLVKKSNVSFSFSEIISAYIGFPIPSFDYYFNHIDEYSCEYFGQHTLYSLNGILRKFNNEIPNELYQYSDFFVKGRIGGNVYTQLRRYLQDYSYLGLFILIFVQGFVYSFSYGFSKKGGILLVLFATFFYPIVEASIEERFLSKVLSVTSIYLIFYIVFIYILFTKKITKR